MDRNIPHIRDIFSAPRKKAGEFQDLCMYDRSPRSRRRVKAFDVISDFDPQDNWSQKKRNDKGGKENLKINDEMRLLPEANNKSTSNKQQYCSKTLTERDIRHLERHLSMKKTIRKQISRNLAQAFVDNPSLFESNPKPATMSKAKLAKSEQNVLDMLKISIEERDSGHSSPTNEVLAQEEDAYDGKYDGVNDHQKSWAKGHRHSETKLLPADHSDNKTLPSEKKSIWKLFSPRSKGKR